MFKQWNHKVFNLKTGDFNDFALALFRFQYQHNPVYRDFTDHLGIQAAAVTKIEEIPFLPISLFKTKEVKTTEYNPEKIFESSGTTGMINSRHFLKDIAIYEESFTRGFIEAYGPVTEYCILGLLPAYLERQGSSLVYMAEKLIKMSGHAQSGFYLHDLEKLASTLQQLEETKQKTILIGVTFALLDFAEQFPMPLQHTMIMETGGMKGRRAELLRAALHAQLQKAFGVPSIHSEYGMTELLSQAYSSSNGLYQPPPWMKVLVRDEEDPFVIRQYGAGILNIIDLANIYSCSFIATDDAGKTGQDGRFEVLGRIDNSDLRGCSLLVV